MHKLTLELKKQFEEAANEELASKMEKYLKNRFSLLGLQSPIRKEIQKVVFKEIGFPKINEIEQICTELWEMPQREFQYVAIDILKRIAKKVPVYFIDFYEKLIINKSWWDSVDMLAANIIVHYFKLYSDEISAKIEKWRYSENIWLVRTCIIFQLKYKKDTNLDLLFDLIRENCESKEFFIQKAIGWALREYSKTSPDIVMQFVENQHLAPLSKREALKIIKKK